MDFSHADAVDTAVLNQVYAGPHGPDAMPAPTAQYFLPVARSKIRAQAKARDLD